MPNSMKKITIFAALLGSLSGCTMLEWLHPTQLWKLNRHPPSSVGDAYFNIPPHQYSDFTSQTSAETAGEVSLATRMRESKRKSPTQVDDSSQLDQADKNASANASTNNWWDDAPDLLGTITNQKKLPREGFKSLDSIR